MLLTPRSATATVSARFEDNDASISINDVSANEGNLSKGKKNADNPQLKDFVFTISLSNAVAHSVMVDYSTVDGTATTSGGDYQGAAASVTFAAGEVSKTVTISVVGDNDQEPDETFSIQLSNAQGAAIFDGVGTGTILNDDGSGGGGGGNGGGGGGCNPNSPKCNSLADEIELQDPIWWFEGPDGDGGDLHDHDHNHEPLPHESVTVLAIGMLVTLDQGSDLPLKGSLSEVQKCTDIALIDRALADLEFSSLPNSVESQFATSSETSESDAEETGLHEDLLDAAFDEIVDMLL